MVFDSFSPRMPSDLMPDPTLPLPEPVREQLPGGILHVNANLLEIAMEAREWLISQGQNDEATRARIARIERAIAQAKGLI